MDELLTEPNNEVMVFEPFAAALTDSISFFVVRPFLGMIGTLYVTVYSVRK